MPQALPWLVLLSVLSDVPDEARAAGQGSGGRSGPCATAGPTAELTKPGEKGRPMVVTGQVFGADGVTPAAGVILYVYQTDITGRYGPSSSRAPRLRAWIRTDAEGRYTYKSIRPEPYPGGRIAAHVHTQLWGEGVPIQWNAELLFDDDPLVSEKERAESRAAGRFAWVRSGTLDASGVLRLTHDLRLKAAGDRLEASIRHGLEACGM